MFGAVLLIASSAAVQTQPQDPSLFLAEIQRIAKADDREAMASLVEYPATASIGGLRVLIADAASLVDRYDSIFTVAMRETIALASVPQPDVRTAKAGAPERWVIGSNAVQFGAIGGRIKITAFVVPPARPTDAAVLDQGQATRSEPRRIGVRAGPGPTRFAGSIYAGSTDAYVVHVPKGQLLSVRLERVRAGEAVLRVVHVATGEPLNPRAANDGRFVAGTALDSADYRIEVQRSSGDAVPVPYTLSVSLR